MARFYLKDYASFNNCEDIHAVTWQIGLDESFSIIVDETIFDTENILSWWSPLRKLDNKGFLDENSVFYVRVKIYSNINGQITESDWFTVKEDKNNAETITIRYKGKIVKEIKKET